jgi:hypothetical protein
LFSLQSTSKFLCGYYCHLHGWVFRLDKILPEVNEWQNRSLAAYSADLLRGVYLFLIAFKLRPLRAVMVGAQVRLCHFAHLLSDL